MCIGGQWIRWKGPTCAVNNVLFGPTSMWLDFSGTSTVEDVAHGLKCELHFAAATWKNLYSQKHRFEGHVCDAEGRPTHKIVGDWTRYIEITAFESGETRRVWELGDSELDTWGRSAFAVSMLSGSPESYRETDIRRREDIHALSAGDISTARRARTLVQAKALELDQLEYEPLHFLKVACAHDDGADRYVLKSSHTRSGSVIAVHDRAVRISLLSVGKSDLALRAVGDAVPQPNPLAKLHSVLRSSRFALILAIAALWIIWIIAAASETLLTLAWGLMVLVTLLEFQLATQKRVRAASAILSESVGSVVRRSRRFWRDCSACRGLFCYNSSAEPLSGSAKAASQTGESDVPLGLCGRCSIGADHERMCQEALVAANLTIAQKCQELEQACMAREDACRKRDEALSAGQKSEFRLAAALRSLHLAKAQLAEANASQRSSDDGNEPTFHLRFLPRSEQRTPSKWLVHEFVLRLFEQQQITRSWYRFFSHLLEPIQEVLSHDNAYDKIRLFTFHPTLASLPEVIAIAAKLEQAACTWVLSTTETDSWVVECFLFRMLEEDLLLPWACELMQGLQCGDVDIGKQLTFMGLTNGSFVHGLVDSEALSALPLPKEAAAHALRVIPQACRTLVERQKWLVDRIKLAAFWQVLRVDHLPWCLVQCLAQRLLEDRVIVLDAYRTWTTDENLVRIAQHLETHGCTAEGLCKFVVSDVLDMRKSQLVQQVEMCVRQAASSAVQFQLGQDSGFI